MCARVFLSGRTTVVPDASLDDWFRDDPFVSGDLGSVRFYASIPLVADGVPLGSLCVFSDREGSLEEAAREVLESPTTGRASPPRNGPTSSNQRPA